MNKELRAIKINVCGQLCWLNNKFDSLYTKLSRYNESIEEIKRCVW